MRRASLRVRNTGQWVKVKLVVVGGGWKERRGCLEENDSMKTRCAAV